MFAFLMTIVYAMEVVASKDLLTQIKSQTYLRFKFLIPFVLYLIYAVFFSELFITSTGILYLALILGLIVVTQICIFWSLKRVNASTFGVINQMTTVIVLFISLLFGEALTVFKLLSSVLVVLGVYFMVRSEKENKKQNMFALGIAFLSVVIISANINIINYSFENALFSQSAYVLGFLTSIILYFNIIYYASKKERREVASKKQILTSNLIGIIGLGTIAFQSLAIEYSGAFLTAIALALSPVLILIMSVLMKKEKLTVLKIVGITLTLAGVIISNII